MEYNTLENWTLERTIRYVLETSYKYKDSTEEFMNFFQSLENKTRRKFKEKDEHFILLFLKFCRAIQYHSNKDYIFALDYMKNVFLEDKSTGHRVKEIKSTLNSIKNLPSYINDGRYRVVEHEIGRIVNEYEKYLYNIGNEKYIAGEKMTDDDFFAEYLKDYFAEEMKNGLITRIDAFDYREYTFFFAELSTLEIRVMETEESNGVSLYMSTDSTDGDTSEYLAKFAKFMNTDKFKKLYKNLENYWFIQYRAEEYEEKYLNS